MAQAEEKERVVQQQDRPSADAEVVCFFSGLRVRRDKAVQVKLGPGRKVWMHPRFCRDG